MIKKYEEISMNAFPPGMCTYYDGWILRMSEGPSKRLNSVNMLYESSLDINEKITYCESLYEKHGYRKVFKITDLSEQTVGKILVEKGYTETGHTHVQTCALTETKMDENVTFTTQLKDEWLKAYCQCGNKDPKVYKTAWGYLIQDMVFMTVSIDDKAIGFGVGVIENGSIGIFGVQVQENFRRQGYGEKITRNLMKYGAVNSCDYAYLQVEKGNKNAVKLYHKLGFETLYNYYYLVKDDQ